MQTEHTYHKPFNELMPAAYAQAREQRGPLDSALGIERPAVPAKLSAAAAEAGLMGLGSCRITKYSFFDTKSILFK